MQHGFLTSQCIYPSDIQYYPEFGYSRPLAEKLKKILHDSGKKFDGISSSISSILSDHSHDSKSYENKFINYHFARDRLQSTSSVRRSGGAFDPDVYRISVHINFVFHDVDFVY